MQDSIDIVIGKRLYQRRMALEMTQQYLAKQLGVSFQQIQKYERGTNSISSSSIYYLSNILKVPVTFFFETLGKEILKENLGNNSNENNQFPGSRKKVDHTLSSILSACRVLKPELRKNILHLVKALSQSEINLIPQENVKCFSSMEFNRDNLIKLINKGMKKQNLSMAALAKQANIKADIIRDFLRGKSYVLRADKLQKIMQVLGPDILNSPPLKISQAIDID